MGALAALGATTIHLTNLRLSGIVALVLGVLIWIFPKFLRYLVGGYLIIVGVISVFNLHL